MGGPKAVECGLLCVEVEVRDTIAAFDAFKVVVAARPYGAGDVRCTGGFSDCVGVPLPSRPAFAAAKEAARTAAAAAWGTARLVHRATHTTVINPAIPTALTGRSAWCCDRSASAASVASAGCKRGRSNRR